MGCIVGNVGLIFEHVKSQVFPPSTALFFFFKCIICLCESKTLTDVICRIWPKFNKDGLKTISGSISPEIATTAALCEQYSEF